jgi:SAM-dependent methyltransferase
MSSPRRVDYDAIAAEYDNRYRDTSFPGLEAALRQHVADAPGLRVLEVGCGSGHFVQVLGRLGAQVLGLDISLGMLQQARGRSGNALLVRASAERLPCASGCFDRVCAINAMHHFDDKRAFLREVARVLPEGGTLFSVGLDPHQGLDRWFVYDYFRPTLAVDCARFPAAREIWELMDEAGFSDCVSFEVERLKLAVPAREALANGKLTRHTTSQLALLSEAEYAAGIARIQRELARAESAGETLLLRVDVRLYASVGTRA